MRPSSKVQLKKVDALIDTVIKIDPSLDFPLESEKQVLLLLPISTTLDTERSSPAKSKLETSLCSVDLDLASPPLNLDSTWRTSSSSSTPASALSSTGKLLLLLLGSSSLDLFLFPSVLEQTFDQPTSALLSLLLLLTEPSTPLPPCETSNEPTGTSPMPSSDKLQS